jgi:hypothetical protein
MEATPMPFQLPKLIPVMLDTDEIEMLINALNDEIGDETEDGGRIEDLMQRVAALQEKLPVRNYDVDLARRTSPVVMRHLRLTGVPARTGLEAAANAIAQAAASAETDPTMAAWAGATLDNTGGEARPVEQPALTN